VRSNCFRPVATPVSAQPQKNQTGLAPNSLTNTTRGSYSSGNIFGLELVRYESLVHENRKLDKKESHRSLKGWPWKQQ
jgi:hypothetical protein